MLEKEIKINELRIGNIVEFNGGKVEIVTILGKKNLSPYLEAKVCLSGNGTNEYTPHELNEISPFEIKINDVVAYFSEYNQGNPDPKIIFEQDRDYLKIIERDSLFYIVVKSPNTIALHYLQNLYFVFAEEDLDEKVWQALVNFRKD
jgi:hypothetical protein